MNRPDSALKSPEVRGQLETTNSPTVHDIILETTKLWRRHHLSYDQTKHVVEQTYRVLKLRPPRERERTVVVRGCTCGVERSVLAVQPVYSSSKRGGQNRLGRARPDGPQTGATAPLGGHGGWGAGCRPRLDVETRRRAHLHSGLDTRWSCFSPYYSKLAYCA